MSVRSCVAYVVESVITDFSQPVLIIANVTAHLCLSPADCLQAQIEDVRSQALHAAAHRRNGHAGLYYEAGDRLLTSSSLRFFLTRVIR